LEKELKVNENVCVMLSVGKFSASGSVMVPSLSGLTEYEENPTPTKSPTLFATTPGEIISIATAVMSPAPSAVKLPIAVTKPVPLSRNAYCPFNFAFSGLGLAGLVRVTVAKADLVRSATDVAVTVTVVGMGTVAGAMYLPAESIVPQLTPHEAFLAFTAVLNSEALTI